MNRLIHMGILAAIASALIGGVAAAGMYWDQSQDPDAAMARTAQDARSSEPSLATATPAHPVKMYDDGQTLEVDSFDEPRPARTPRIQSEPPTTDTAPASPRRIAPLAPSPARQSIAPRAQEPAVEQEKPQPITSAPGSVTEKRPEARTGQAVVVPQSGSGKALEAAAPPVTKRMPWGKAEVKQEQKTNLKWGSSGQN